MDGEMARTFSAQVEDWVRKSKARSTAVFRESVSRVGEQAQTTVHEGGKMPIDTGFLRASYSVSLNGMPFGQSNNPGGQFAYKQEPVDLTIAGAQVGDSIWGGWTANYAKFMEERYGFMRSAAQSWQQIVDGVVREVRARFP